MAADRPEVESAHEVRLEGVGLMVGGALLLAAIVGAFFLGRWVERRAQPAGVGADRSIGALSHVAPAEPEVAQPQREATHFDDLAGAEKQLEPARQAVAPAPVPPSEALPADRGVAAASAGTDGGVAPYWVQVSAGRDRQAAESLVNTLRQGGFPVRLFPERQAGQAWFKVRVGGYQSEERARAAADELKRSGYAQAFVSVLGG